MTGEFAPTAAQVARADQNIMWTRALLGKMVEDAAELLCQHEGLALFEAVGQEVCDVLVLAEDESDDGDPTDVMIALLAAAVIQLASQGEADD